jgi:hypothetical protein
MPCPRNAPSPYVPRAATDTVLHDIVQAELAPFLAAARAAEVALPPYVEAELRAFLRCGVLACGFGRARCVALASPNNKSVVCDADLRRAAAS